MYAVGAGAGFGVFASVMAPASFFLGFAVATAGFTCWNLVMPLLFNWLGFALYDALFLSVMMDTASSLVLVLLYLQHGKVDKPFVLHFGGVAAIAGAVSSRLSDSFLESHTHLLRGSVGYVPLFFGLLFAVRAAKEHARVRAIGAAALGAPRADGCADPPPDDAGSSGWSGSDGVELLPDFQTRSHSLPTHARALAPKAAAYGTPSAHALDAPPCPRWLEEQPPRGGASPSRANRPRGWLQPLPPLRLPGRRVHSAGPAQPRTPARVHADGRPVRAEPPPCAAPQPAMRSASDAARAAEEAAGGGGGGGGWSTPLGSPPLTARAFSWARETLSPPRSPPAPSPGRMLLRSQIVHGAPGARAADRAARVRTRRRRMGLTALLLGVLGAVCGIVGSGGGVMYVSVIMLVWGVDDLPLATGTGVALMCFQCAALLANFVDKPQVVRPQMLACLAIVLPCCVTGAALASRALLYMSKVSVNLTVSAVSFALGATITLTSLS
ncbi:hypothetical protein KFE25_011085 [Diacronema lutheri]|uniref:Uncharacterized protein n=1 Tax=Diacronema lutheri TaxID=2081491 RepID=A0A8J6CD21_DIALT|nr:hypothetical protein KFE25_011085 [Diacronema lutheri]